MLVLRHQLWGNGTVALSWGLVQPGLAHLRCDNLFRPTRCSPCFACHRLALIIASARVFFLQCFFSIVGGDLWPIFGQVRIGTGTDVDLRIYPVPLQRATSAASASYGGRSQKSTTRAGCSPTGRRAGLLRNAARHRLTQLEFASSF